MLLTKPLFVLNLLLLADALLVVAAGCYFRVKGIRTFVKLFSLLGFELTLIELLHSQTIHSFLTLFHILTHVVNVEATVSLFS